MLESHASRTTSASAHLLPTSLRALIIASAYWVLSISLTTQAGSVAAFVGCLVTCYGVDVWIHRSPLRHLRTTVIATAAAFFLLVGALLSRLLTDSNVLADLLSPILSYQAGEVVLWLFFSIALTTVLRSLAHRSSLGTVLEIVFVASAFVVTLAAHRQGMIHRPFFLGDFALSRGIDPSSILLALGCVAVLSLAALLMMEQNQRRLPYHFGVLALLCFSLLAYVQVFGLPSPRLTDDLGLTGTASAGGGRESENPFRDGENDASDREAPVAIVLFRDDYEPANGAYYFRESAYSEFNGRMLDIPRRADMGEDLIDHFTSTRAELPEELPAMDRRKAVRTTIGLLAPHRTPFGLDTPVAYENTPNPNNLRFKQTYDAYSQVPQFDFPDLIGKSAGDPDWTDEQWENYLALPDDPRYRDAAEAIVADLRPEFSDNPYARALAIKGFFDENGIYSLKNEHAYAEDPAASFLFGDLTGYCMHFAFASTYLFRSIGIPARVGIGYSVPAANRAGGSSLLIQAINGHAWPEIYLEDIGWVIVDPAPSQTLVDMSVDPQNTLQQMLGDMLRDEAAFEAYLDSRQDETVSIATIGRSLAALLAALLVLGYLIKFYRLRVPYFAGAGQQYRLSYRASLDALAASGYRRRYGESRESFAERISAISPSFRTMTQSHLRHALGTGTSATDVNESARGVDESARGSDEKQLKTAWLSLHSRVRRELYSRLPSWKRVLGFVNPFAWLRTR